MKIPFLDLHQGYLELKDEIDSSVARVLDSGRYILGSEVENFEDVFSRYCGSKFAIGVANGMDALEISLRALSVSDGDEVIVPAHTFIATWLAVSKVGAIPVPVEPDPLTYNIDTDKIKEVITSKTKAIIPVHLYGQPVNLDPIIEIAKQNNIYVLEDAAQAIGSKYKGKRIGIHGDLVSWSFYPSKNLGAFGDAGAITTNNSELAERILFLRNYGSTEKYSHQYLGMNSRLDPIQASILRVKLKYLDLWNQRRKEIASIYSNSFKDYPLIVTPFVPEWADPVWHLYVIQSAKRSSIQKYLHENDIETLIHYPVPPHRQQVYKEFFPRALGLAKTESLAQNVLSLPMGPHLSDVQQKYVIRSLLNFLSK